MDDTECENCGATIPSDSDECPECGERIENNEDQDTNEEVEKAMKTLDKIDEDTYEIRNGDSDSILQTIKELGAESEFEERARMSESEEEDVGDEEEIIVYECPVCGSEVSEDDDECPGCGAVFEE